MKIHVHKRHDIPLQVFMELFDLTIQVEQIAEYRDDGKTYRAYCEYIMLADHNSDCWPEKEGYGKSVDDAISTYAKLISGKRACIRPACFGRHWVSEKVYADADLVIPRLSYVLHVDDDERVEFVHWTSRVSRNFKGVEE